MNENSKVGMTRSMVDELVAQFGLNNVDVSADDYNNDARRMMDVHITDEQLEYLKALDGYAEAKVDSDWAKEINPSELFQKFADVVDTLTDGVDLGDMVEDTITGFTGSITAVTIYLTEDEDQMCVENEDGERWFAKSRLSKIGE